MQFLKYTLLPILLILVTSCTTTDPDDDTTPNGNNTDNRTEIPTLVSGDTVSGTIPSIDYIQKVNIEITENGVYLIKLDSVDVPILGELIRLDIYNEAGSKIISHTTSSVGKILAYDQLLIGNYQAHIYNADPYNDRASTVPFIVTLHKDTTDLYEFNDYAQQAAPINLDDIITLTILPYYDHDFFKLTVEKPGNYQVAFKDIPVAFESFNFNAQILDGNGNENPCR